MATSIDPNHILHIEDVRLKEVYSVHSYIMELVWFRSLIGSHIERCKYWEKNESRRPGLGKLNEFLSQLEEEER